MASAKVRQNDLVALVTVSALRPDVVFESVTRDNEVLHFSSFPLKHLSTFGNDEDGLKSYAYHLIGRVRHSMQQHSVRRRMS